MKLNELCDELKRLGVSKDLYSIMPNGMPNEKLCLECEGEWKIYYSERGSKAGEMSFLTEEEACEAFLQKVKNMLNFERQNRTCITGIDKMKKIYLGETEPHKR